MASRVVADPTKDNVVPIGAAPPPGSNGNGNWYLSVERRLATIESDLKHMATKADVEAAMNNMLKWGIGLIIAVAGLLSYVLFRILDWSDRFIPGG